MTWEFKEEFTGKEVLQKRLEERWVLVCLYLRRIPRPSPKRLENPTVINLHTLDSTRIRGREVRPVVVLDPEVVGTTVETVGS